MIPYNPATTIGEQERNQKPNPTVGGNADIYTNSLETKYPQAFQNVLLFHRTIVIYAVTSLQTSACPSYREISGYKQA